MERSGSVETTVVIEQGAADSHLPIWKTWLEDAFPELVVVAVAALLAQWIAARFRRAQTETDVRRRALIAFSDSLWSAIDKAMDYSRRKYSPAVGGGFTVDRNPVHALESGFMEAHQRLRGLSVQLMFFDRADELVDYFNRLVGELEGMTNFTTVEEKATGGSFEKLNKIREGKLVAGTEAFARMSEIMVNEITPGKIGDSRSIWQKLSSRIRSRQG